QGGQGKACVVTLTLFSNGFPAPYDYSDFQVD
ncbi:MAG: hypothetical protein ACI84E_001798, partial [Planctomycetota bacterium]